MASRQLTPLLRRVGLLLAFGLVASGCAASDLALPAPTRSAPPGDAPIGIGPDLSDPDDVANAAMHDVSAFWNRTFPEIYSEPMEPIGGLFAYDDQTDPPDCGGEELDYESLADNAYYCPFDDYVAWDRVGLIPRLVDDFGPFSVGIVMAHEFAHAIQSRAEVTVRPVTLELQADCFAGAWARDVALGNSAFFRASGADLDLAVAGFIELRDFVGVGARNPRAHGSGFDRIAAFQDGLDDGARRCAEYEDDPPPVVASEFRTADDFVRGGNLPTADLIDLLVPDIDNFFADLLDREGAAWDPIDAIRLFDRSADDVCTTESTPPPDGFYCEADDAVYLESSTYLPRLEAIGDFAVGGEIARQFATSAQRQLGIDGDDVARHLHADCMLGLYTSAEYREVIPEQRLRLSPGDVDEIIIAFLADDSGDDGTVFERTAAFRTGFFDDLAACAEYL